MANANGLVVTRTPLRISFAGGGTDLAAFYESAEGAVLSTAIDRYVYVTLKRHDALFEAPIRLNYSETEQVTRVSEIRNRIARACFEFLGVEPPIYMSTVADMPAASGLGSSSAFCVGLLHALHAWRGEQASAGQLAEEAAHVEIDLLGRPIGKQDHYAAAFGGFNCFRFSASGGVAVQPQQFSGDGLSRLFHHLMLFWTGMTRDAGDVLDEQRAATSRHSAELVEIRNQALALQQQLGNGFRIEEVGRTLDQGWQLKRKLASTISNSKIDHWYRRALEAGAWGGKLCGAGGGGFFLFLAPPERQQAVRQELAEMREIRPGYEPRGSRLLMPNIE